jgi:hypothetical protein
MTSPFPHPRNDRGYRERARRGTMVRPEDEAVVSHYFFGGAGNNA